MLIITVSDKLTINVKMLWRMYEHKLEFPDMNHDIQVQVRN